MLKIDLQKNKSSLIFVAGLFVFFGLNLFSAFTMGVHFDEAYYWLYSKKLDFGYFDHPPMIGWLIYAGRLLFNDALGLRFFIVLLSSVSVFLLWQLTKGYSNKPLLFWALIYSVILIHPYSFIATPDAPLFFFTTLFFFTYNRYLKNQNASNIVVFALATALMVYSKYHAVLVIGFTFLSNLKQLRKKEFWFYVVLLLIFMIPQISWQINHNFISFRYHLIDSHSTAYQPAVTIEYLLNQIALTGPWLGWLFLFVLFTIRPSNTFEKGLKWLGMGTFVFFLIATFSGDFEAHWTLIAFVPLIVLAYKYLINHKKWQRWVFIGGSINFMLLLLIRIIVVTPLAGKIHALGFFNGWDTDSAILKSATGDQPIIFQDNWNKAARFAYYTNDPTVTNLNSALHRNNQFDIWDIDELDSGKTVFVITTDSTQFENAKKVQTPKVTWYVKSIPDFRSYYNLTFTITQQKKIEDQLNLTVDINNVYDEEIDLGQTGASGKFQLYRKEGKKWLLLNEFPITKGKIAAKTKQEQKVCFDLGSTDFSNLYLMLKIGELNPIPLKPAIKLMP